MRLWFKCLGLALGVLLAGGAVLAQDKEAARKLAMEVPIADVHLHLYPGLTPQELQARMDRNNVQWGGGVGPILANIDQAAFVQHLGKRYVAAGAQPELASIYLASGTGPMVDAESAWFKTLIPQLEADFRQKKITGIGELILNNRMSHPTPAFRRKLPVDAPTFAALFQLAEQHKGFVQVHMEDDSDSVAQLKGLLTKHPDVPVILSHCMARAQASTARALLEKHANLYCETSARSSVLLFAPQLQPFVMHNDNYLQPAWAELIEAMPDRFMVGSDVTSDQISYDNAIRTVRGGLLANLSEATLKKVAYGNAERVLRLQR